MKELSPISYNPFEGLAKNSFRIQMGYTDLVLQYFKCPAVKDKTDFLLTSYPDIFINWPIAAN
ncbi:hypothetical protein [uncultured Sphingobacterium sp.]|uniref:hypothetical protein n=1 Tax=uncultured Sphingobacterium sp. TaxID=182688 RepID=UPI0025D7F9BA|nr:hypothetical protein [uncultured Sphingobacterium sp.]